MSSLKDMFDIDNKEDQFVIALAGNPNTGKSTVFNHLTGLRQHTGNGQENCATARGNLNIKYRICINRFTRNIFFICLITRRNCSS
ncbi:hypothetical protein BM533_19160 [Clostridioides difficile]|nr:hypothetical protein BM533_19160 [Clostridioides difficile]